MIKTIIVLPDGTELSSGVGATNAIQSVTITASVNDANELSLGSACANMVEAKLITPNGGLHIAAGDEIAVYRADETGTRHKIGLFTTEKPTRSSANSYSITAYDRISWLDKDLTQWLAGLAGWPYSLFTLADMVCRACGLELVNKEIPNGNYPVQKFSADGITGRQLMQWIGQAAGRFCRATPDGQIEFAWYQPVEKVAIGPKQLHAASVSYDGEGDISILSDRITATDDGLGNVAADCDILQLVDDGEGNVSVQIPTGVGQLYYYQNALTQEDYTVAQIAKVQIRQNEEDIGTIYPDDTGDVNTYIITGNPLLVASTAETLRPIAQTLYEQLKDVSYRPCKVSVPASMDIHAGDIVNITDRNGLSFSAYVMTKTTSGQKDTLECTGSQRRDSSTAVNNQSYKALSGKVLNLRCDVDGIKAENKDTQGNLASLKLSVDNISSTVQRQEKAEENLKDQLTKVEQTASGLSVRVSTIESDGVSRVETGLGYTFDDAGLHIRNEAKQMENLLDHTGMKVTRNGKTMLQADEDGVLATDVTVNSYLIVGNSRFESYGGGTGCFYFGG